MERFFLSDHHFGHPNIYKFTGASGDRIRPWAETTAEAEEMMIDAHNDVVSKKDTIYLGGDVAIRKPALALLSRMNGRKILIRGNHDIFKLKDYVPYFEDIRSEHKMDRIVITHRPMHTSSIPHWCLGNVHGHTHEKDVLREDGSPDERYLNICVEKVGIRPLPYDELVSRLVAARPDFFELRGVSP